MVRPERRAASTTGAKSGDRPLVAAWVATLLLTMVPYPGRWLILAVVLPMVVVGGYYVSRRAGLRAVALAPPVAGWRRTFAQAVALVAGLWALRAFVIHPLLAALFEDSKDLSLFDPMKGSLGHLMIFLASMWLIAAFGEEFVWRGFLLRTAGGWLAGRVRRPWVWAVVGCAGLWALTHAYQGPRGVVEKLIGGSILGSIYVRGDRSSLWLVVLVHGLGNTLSFVAIYFDAYSKLYPFS